MRHGKVASAIILLFTITSSIGCFNTPQEEPLSQRLLWYSAPAQHFEEALPLGNGRLGAMVFGGVQQERIVLNEETLWAGGPVDAEMNPEAYKNLPEVRKALFAGDYELADKLVRSLQGKFSESYAPLGDLIISMNHGQDYSNYKRSLDLRNAVSQVEYQVGKTRYSRQALASFPHQVIAIKLKASAAGQLGFSLSMRSKLKFKTGTAGNDLVMSGFAPLHAEPNYRGDMPDAVVYDDVNSMRFQAIATITETDGEIISGQNSLSLQGATQAVVILSMATSFNGFDKNPGTEGKDEKLISQTNLRSTLEIPFDTILQRHKDDFRSYFNRVSIQLGNISKDSTATDIRLKEYASGAEDPGLEALYFQYGRYLLISSSRPGGIPANLQGIWNHHLRPPWSSNFTTNINLEMNYWPAEVSNLSELHEPLLRFISDLENTGQVSARTFFGAGGWSCSHNSDIWAMTNPVGDFGKGHPCWANWNMAGAWLSTHLWEHYEFSQDKEYLRDYAYPLMKGAAEFCLDWLIEGKGGHLVTAPSTSPENIYLTPEGYQGATAIATTSDMAMIRELFQDVIKACSILGQDQEFREEVESALTKLFPYQIGTRGNLQEWQHDWEDADPEHRHVSHLFGLYPGHHITPEDTPELAAAVKQSLELRGDGGTGWSKAWKINLWARLGDGNRAHKLLRSHLTYSDPSGKTEYKGGGTYPNLLDAHPPFQIDGNFGGTAGIAEMLLQSRNGKIILLPSLPDAWPEGHVRGLKARGNFEVDITWQKGVLRQVKIKSYSGKSCKLLYKGKSKEISLNKDEELFLNLKDFN